MKFKVGDHIELINELDECYNSLNGKVLKIKKIGRCGDAFRKNMYCDDSCKHYVVFEGDVSNGAINEWCNVFENFRRTSPIPKPKKFNLYLKNEI